MKQLFQSRRKGRLSAELDPATAEQMLGNVFSACGMEPNSVPLEVLSSYSNYRKERYALQRAVIAAVLALFLLLPLLFVYARIRVTLVSAPDSNPVYEVSVSSKMPVRQIQAEMEGRTVPIYEISDHEYMIQPSENGEITVSLSLLNRQESALSFTVGSVDADAPQLTATEMDEHYVYLYVSDADSGVNFEGVQITAADGSAIPPHDWNAEEGWLALPYPEQMLDLRIPDARGNVLNIQLKPEG